MATKISGMTAADLPLTGNEELELSIPGSPRETRKATAQDIADLVTVPVDAMTFKGVIDASATPNYPAADAGDVYKISVAGKVGGASGAVVEAGDTIYCITDATAAGTQAVVGANWVITQVNVDGAVVGPASVVSGHLAVFSGTTGKLIADGGVAPTGTVTSVAVSVPSFLSIAGSPITAAGTLALSYSGTGLPIANGGTAGTTASAARTALGLVIGTDVQGYTAALAAVSGTNTGDQSSISGNAGTATALATPRAINGVAFDGTTTITVPAAAGTLTGATLAAGVTASSLTSVGTLASLAVAGPVTQVTDLTTTGNTILGNASTDTLNVGNGGIIKDASGNVGIGVTPSAAKITFRASVPAAVPTWNALDSMVSEATSTNLWQLHAGVAGGTLGYLFAVAGSRSVAGMYYDTSSSLLQFYASGASRLDIAAAAVTPGTDNTQNLGSGALRWATVYAGTGTINTSDAREKTAVAPLTKTEVEASKRLAKEIGSYRWLEAVTKKGDAARLHIGLTVQRAIEIMSDLGLDATRYAFICYDEWDGGDRYSFRHDELLLFLARGFDARLAALEGNV